MNQNPEHEFFEDLKPEVVTIEEVESNTLLLDFDIVTYEVEDIDTIAGFCCSCTDPI